VRAAAVALAGAAEDYLIRSFWLAGAALAIPAGAWAQVPADAAAPPPPPTEVRASTDGAQTPSTPPASPAREQDAASLGDQAIVVTGFRRNREDVLSGTSVVSGEQLTRELRPTIGETLSRQPGVSATSFGPNASRPVLRGFSGERVRVLTDGIGSLDVSSSSADHAVAINPLTAERIEVLRGPAALLFGSEAVGGVVNVIDARIPRRVPDEPVHLQGILTYGSAADERSANGTVDVPVGEHFVVHADGNYSKSDDLRIGGYVLSKALRDEAAASGDPAIRALANLKGRLPNTAGQTDDLAVGAAYIDGSTNVGLSVNHYHSLYGVPIRYSLVPGEPAEAPRIDMNQTRVDGRAEIGVGGGFIDQIRVRGGYADYKHNELGVGGAVGTTFLSKGAEGRLEFVQANRGGWGGGFGAQAYRRDMNVIGDEKFLPPNRTEQLGLFALQSYVAGPFHGEAGLRFERQNVHADADADLGNASMTRSFSSVSGSLGASYQVAPGVKIGLNGSRTVRAPSGDELFANGPHGGTQAFEVGDPHLSQERSWGLEATFGITRDAFSLTASVFHSWFDNYLYERRTGAVRDELPVYQISQAQARYGGVELDGTARVATFGAWTINLDGVADYIRATIVGVGPAPRIPPLRVLGGIEAQSEKLQARLEVEHVARQNRVAPLETPTPGYTMVNASVSFTPLKEHKSLNITLAANNIFDVDARRHASFLKDYAPLAGRDIRLSARFSF
jgi:iron complex outermembrane receptor protein